MKWVLCGKNDVAIACLELLLERGDEVMVVATAGDDGADGWQHSLLGAARRLGTRIEQPRRINDAASVERLAAYDARALISIQYDQILKNALFHGVGYPCLNLHYSLLPRHRGVYPIAWAILEGDDETGVTLHHMVEDIDAGDVIAQRHVPIGPGDTAREVYTRQGAAAVELLRESYPFPDALLATRLPQDTTRACYHSFGDLDYSKREVDWKLGAEELHRWIRMMIFPPLNLPETRKDGRPLVIRGIDAAPGKPVEAPPGTVVGVDETGIDVAAANRTLRITALADAAAPDRVDASLLRSLAVGDRLG